MLFRRGGRCLQDLHLAINAQDLGHLFGEVGIAPFQIISHFVRLNFFLIQNLANRALRQSGEARVPFRRSVLARMTSQKPGRPQFVGVTEVLRFAARQRHEPSLGLERDPGFPARTRTIVERRHRAFHHGPLDAALDRLVVQPQRLTDREKRRIFPIGEQYSRPFDPTRRLGPRLRDPSQLSRILVFQRQFDRPTPRRHKFNPCSVVD